MENCARSPKSEKYWSERVHDLIWIIKKVMGAVKSSVNQGGLNFRGKHNLCAAGRCQRSWTIFSSLPPQKRLKCLSTSWDFPSCCCSRPLTVEIFFVCVWIFHCCFIPCCLIAMNFLWTNFLFLFSSAALLYCVFNFLEFVKLSFMIDTGLQGGLTSVRKYLGLFSFSSFFWSLML